MGQIFQNIGHLGSRCTYIHIYIYGSPLCIYGKRGANPPMSLSLLCQRFPHPVMQDPQRHEPRRDFGHFVGMITGTVSEKNQKNTISGVVFIRKKDEKNPQEVIFFFGFLKLI